MQSGLKQFTILVVEDDAIMQKLIRGVLFKLGFDSMHSAENGNAALALMRDQTVDFIITDWRMPDMDGLEFTKIVRASKGAHALVPIIMLTGNAEQHHVCTARDVGVNEYLIKPFTVKDLCTRLQAIIEQPREFVIARTYKGPSRRRKAIPPAIAERRWFAPPPQPFTEHE